jgi:hypothetical protein
VETLAAALDGAKDIEEAREIEAAAASLYWSGWAANPATTLRFARSDQARLPVHWPTFETRRSVLSSANGNRRAERPLNAMLNYLFALAGAEATLACWVLGLDPGLAIIHADTARRASLALDLIEPIRPAVEDHLLALIAGRSFRRSDFSERADGTIKIMGPLRHELAETLPIWRKALAPHAEAVAHLLAAEVEGRYVTTTPLTNAKSRAAAAEVKARHAARRAAKASQARQRPAAARSTAPYTCLDCGAPVTNARRVRCDSCIEADPRQTPALRQSRAKAISARRQAEAGWSVHHPAGPLDTAWATTTLLPALRAFTVRQVMDAAGVAKGTASGWRNGRHVPHPMHWAILAKLANVPLPAWLSQSTTTVTNKEARDG